MYTFRKEWQTYVKPLCASCTANVCRIASAGTLVKSSRYIAIWTGIFHNELNHSVTFFMMWVVRNRNLTTRIFHTLSFEEF
jgi:hypothetical protein